MVARPVVVLTRKKKLVVLKHVQVKSKNLNILVMGQGSSPARSPGSKARPELDFLGPDPSIGDGSGLKPGPGPSF